MTDITIRTDRRIGFLDPDDAFTRRFVERPFFEQYCKRIDTYMLPDIDLESYPGLIVSSQIDQEYLYTHRGRLTEYLDSGGVVAFSGHLSRRWLPGAETFVPADIEAHDDYDLVEVSSHPVFAGVEIDDLVYQRGVAGFFARGHNPPPEHAQPIIRLAGGHPVVYVDEETTNGTIFAHSGNDLVGFGRRASTAQRVPEQLVAWMHEQSALTSTTSRRESECSARDIHEGGASE